MITKILNNLKKPKAKMILSAVVLVLGIAIMVSSIYAWFTFGDVQNLDDFTFDVVDRRISFTDSVKTTRYINATPQEKIYYKNSGAPFDLTDLLPGEYIDFEVKLYSENNVDSYNYVLGFSGISASTYGDGYSFLGVFRLDLLEYVNDILVPKADTPSRWLASYGESGFTLTTIVIDSASWQANKDISNIVTINFRITLDLSQLNALYPTGSVANILKDQYINISRMYCDLE